MSSYDHIDDEEELHKMMNAAESFDERKKIRTRLREIREKQRDGATTVTTKTQSSSVKQSAGFGGVQYGASRAPAKPQGARGAMAAFKQMDAATSPTGPKPNKPMARSPSAIKTMLLEWCKAMTREYENIEVTNFSTSWNDGLAFCALIHHFYPDAFDYSELDPKNRRYNFELAFNTAEKMADIAPLLDVEDMVKMKTPDWKCVFTYVQSFYRHLRDHENNKAKAPAEA